MGCNCANFSYCNQCFLCNCQQECWNTNRPDSAAYATCAAACDADSIVPEGFDPVDIVYGSRSPSWPGPPVFDFFSGISACVSGYTSCLSGCAPDYSDCSSDYDTCATTASTDKDTCYSLCSDTPCFEACDATYEAALDTCYDAEQACIKPLYIDATECADACISTYDDDIKLALKGTGDSCAQTNCQGESIGAAGDFLSQCLLDEIDTLYEAIWTAAIATYRTDMLTVESNFANCAAACGRGDAGCISACVEVAWGGGQTAYGGYLDSIAPYLSAAQQNQALCMGEWLCKKIDGEKPPACFCDHQGQLKVQDAIANAAWITVKADLERCSGDCASFAFASEFVGDQITCRALCNIEAEKNFFTGGEAGRMSGRASECRDYFPMSAHYHMRDVCRIHTGDLDNMCDRVNTIALDSCINTCCGDSGCIADCATAWEAGTDDCDTPFTSCLAALEDDDFTGLQTCLTDYDICRVSATPLCNSGSGVSICEDRFPLGDCPDCGDESDDKSDDMLCLSAFYNYRGIIGPSVEDYFCD